jgi:hypothetical protein
VRARRLSVAGEGLWAFFFERREDMSDQARITMNDVATRAADCLSALQFLEATTRFSETSEEVCQGFVETARTMLPKVAGDLGEIIAELKAGPDEGGDLANDPALNEVFNEE